METKEQKIERLKKQIEDKEKYLKDTPYLNETIKFFINFQKNRLEQQLKELENESKTCRNS